MVSLRVFSFKLLFKCKYLAQSKVCNWSISFLVFALLVVHDFRQFHYSSSAMRMDCLKPVSSVVWVNDILTLFALNIFWLNQGWPGHVDENPATAGICLRFSGQSRKHAVSAVLLCAVVLTYVKWNPSRWWKFSIVNKLSTWQSNFYSFHWDLNSVEIFVYV